MNRPSFLVRQAGSPAGALAIWSACAFAFYARYNGADFSVWWLLPVVAIAFQTFGAVRKMRQYNQWRKEWNAMGQDKTREEKKPPRFSLSMRLQLAFLVIAAVLILASTLELESISKPVYWASILYILAFCGYHGIVALRGRGAAGHTREGGKAPATAPATWMLNRAFSAPSREFAVRNLPAHSLQLMAPAPARREASYPEPERQEYRQREPVPETSRPNAQAFTFPRISLPAIPARYVAAVVLVCVVGVFAYIRFNSFSTHTQKPVTYDDVDRELAGLEKKRETPVEPQPVEPPAKKKTDSEIVEEVFGGKTSQAQPETAPRPLWGAGTPAAKKEALPPERHEAATEMFQEAAAENKARAILNQAVEASTDYNAEEKKQLLKFFDALEYEPQYKSYWLEIVQDYTAPDTPEKTARRREAMKEAQQRYNDSLKTPPQSQ